MIHCRIAKSLVGEIDLDIASKKVLEMAMQLILEAQKCQNSQPNTPSASG